jgi:hypothetical protein
MMKAIKISLAVVVVAAIAFFVIKSIVDTGKTGKISLPRNQFVERVEQYIDSLGKMPDSKFCKDLYTETQALIKEFYQPLPQQYPYGRFGNTQSENDQWKENLTKNAYSAYVGKFISQAFYVFRNSEWKTEDLQFIRSEYATLQRSALLERNSPVDKKLTEIKQILGHYDEIERFVSACKSFGFSSFGLSYGFPIANVVAKITQARQYLNNDWAYVKNCTRSQNELKKVPQALFRAHVRYLDSKISEWSDMYSNYNSQIDYANNLYRPLKDELDLLDNNTYGASTFDGEYSRLLAKLNVDSQRAYNYFNSRPKNQEE